MASLYMNYDKTSAFAVIPAQARGSRFSKPPLNPLLGKEGQGEVDSRLRGNDNRGVYHIKYRSPI